MSENVDEELLSAYLDDEVAPDQRAYVEQCLRDSPDWRRLCDELRALRASIQALPRYRLDEDLDRRVLADVAMRLHNPIPPDAIPPDAVQPNAGRPVDGPRLAPAETPDSFEWPRLRLPRGWRAWAWPAIAIAAALLIRAFENKPQPQKVAQAPPAQSRPTHAPPEPAPRETWIGAAPSAEQKSSIAHDSRAAESQDALQAPDRAPPGEPSSAMAKSKANFDGEKTVDKADLADDNAADNAADKAANIAVAKSAEKGAETSGLRPADDGVLVVQLQLRPEAIERGAFDALLARNSIVTDRAVDDGAANGLRANRRSKSLDWAQDRKQARAMRSAASAPVSEVYVEASPRQIAGALAEMQQRADEFAAIAVQPAAQSNRQQQLVKYNRLDGSLPATNNAPSAAAATAAPGSLCQPAPCPRPRRPRPRRRGCEIQATQHITRKRTIGGKVTHQARAANQPQAPAAGAPELADELNQQAETLRQPMAQTKGQAAAGGFARGEQSRLDRQAPAAPSLRQQAPGEQTPGEQTFGGQALGEQSLGGQAAPDEQKMRVVFLLSTAPPNDQEQGSPAAPPPPAAPPAPAAEPTRARGDLMDA